MNEHRLPETVSLPVFQERGSLLVELAAGVDQEQKRISGVSVMTTGKTKGHYLLIRENNIEEIVSYGNQKGRVKVNNGHPDFLDGGAVGRELGYLTNFRVSEDKKKALADFVSIETAANKDKLSHIFTLASEYPEALALSAVFHLEQDLTVERRSTYDDYMPFFVTKLDGVDFVTEGAANSALFSAGETSPASVQGQNNVQSPFSQSNSNPMNPANEAVQGQQPNQTAPNQDEQSLTAFERGVNFAKALFSGSKPATTTETEPEGKAELSGNPAPAAQPEPQTEPAGVVMLSTKGGESKIQFNPDELSQGGVMLSAGEDGEIQPAELSYGYYQLEDGKALAVGEDGTIVAFGDPAKDMALTRFQLKFNQSQNVPHTKIGLNAMPASQPGAALERHNNDNIVELAAMLAASKDPMIPDHQEAVKELKALKKVSNRSREVRLASTLDVSSVTARVADVSSLVLNERFAVDPLLSLINTINNTTRNGLNNFNVDVPLLDLTDVDFQRGALGCTPSEDGTVTLNQRTVTVRPISLAHSICPDNFRNVYQGGVYTNNETMPLEAIILETMGESLLRGLTNQLINGNYAGGTDYVDGILTLVDAAVTATDIPADQAVSQSAYTASNALSQVEELTDATTDVMKLRNDLFLFSDYAIHNKYKQNYRNSFGAAYAGTRPDERMTSVDTSPIFTFVPMVQMPENRAILTPASNILLVLQDASAQDPMEVFYDQNDRRMKFRWETFAGVHYGREQFIVTNSIDASGS